MKEIHNTMKDAVKLALNNLNTDNEFKITDAAPTQVDQYLESIGFEFSDSDYDKPDDSVYYTYANYEKGIAIVLEWNGWTHYVGVSGYTLDFLDK